MADVPNPSEGAALRKRRERNKMAQQASRRRLRDRTAMLEQSLQDAERLTAGFALERDQLAAENQRLKDEVHVYRALQSAHASQRERPSMFVDAVDSISLPCDLTYAPVDDIIGPLAGLGGGDLFLSDFRPSSPGDELFGSDDSDQVRSPYGDWTPFSSDE